MCIHSLVVVEGGSQLMYAHSKRKILNIKTEKQLLVTCREITCAILSSFHGKLIPVEIR